MNNIFFGKFRDKPLRCQPRCRWQLLAIISLFSGLLVAGGYWYGKTHTVASELVALEYNIAKQKRLIQEVRQTAAAEFDVLAARLGTMQASVIRLNALGQRLVKVANIDGSEFDFKHPPAYGGPAETESAASIDFATLHIYRALESLNKQLSSREAQLAVLEDVIMNHQLRSEAKPRGRPVTGGWMSSPFGERTDPFTGKPAMHKGMDFAAKEGTEIIAVASGIVTWSGKRSAYGNLIEINHGNGYVTRYGHNASLLVDVGEIVKKGQVISLMGSTGRSTGPHVHFEVLKNDRKVNPSKYVSAK